MKGHQWKIKQEETRIDWLTLTSRKLLRFHVHQLFLSHLLAYKEFLLHCPINNGSLPCSRCRLLKGKAVMKKHISINFFSYFRKVKHGCWKVDGDWLPQRKTLVPVSSEKVSSVRQGWYLVVYSSEKFSCAAQWWIQAFFYGGEGEGWYKSTPNLLQIDPRAFWITLWHAHVPVESFPCDMPLVWFLVNNSKRCLTISFSVE